MVKKYSKSALVSWFHRTSGINNRPNANEIQTVCPMCGGDKLYFNIQKQVGVCHKASCVWHERVFLQDLIDIFGFTPDQLGEWEAPEESKPVEVELPGWPILQIKQQALMTTNQDALDYLRNRGIDDMIILNWGITCDGERIYVPIYNDNNVLANFNSRVLPTITSNSGEPKYLYCRGAKTSHYILGWRECRDWPDLALVENTFVSLAYRYRMRASTTFGSNVSEVQANLIAESGIRRVALLWDEGAEEGADRAIKRLSDKGVRAAYWKIIGQPDDYPIEWVEEKCNLVKEAADNGVPWLDFRT